MGRITQMITYLNVEKHPTKQDKEHYYSHFSIGEEEKKIRKKYRKELKLIDIDNSQINQTI